MSEPDDLVIGRITGCYGIKGWVKIHSFTEPVENFLGYGDCRLRRKQGTEPIVFDSGRRQGKGLIAHIQGVDDRNQAESYKGLEVTAPRAQLPELEQGDYYWHQLEGLAVYSVDGSGRVLLGRVSHLIETGANDVLVVRACSGSLDEQERLIPYLPGDVVTRVDLAAGEMDVDWPTDF
jgi:16S rRNA processing protein RimM